MTMQLPPSFSVHYGQSFFYSATATDRDTYSNQSVPNELYLSIYDGTFTAFQTMSISTDDTGSGVIVNTYTGSAINVTATCNHTHTAVDTGYWMIQDPNDASTVTISVVP